MAYFIACSKINYATHVIDLLFKLVVRWHGLPRTIVSDRDVRFLGHFWRTLWNKLGTKLLFSTVAHPQTDGQTKVVNRTLSTLLRAIIQKNLKNWGKFIPHVEFAYNRIVHSTSSYSPFKKAKFVKELHVKVQANIEKRNEQYAREENKGCVMTFDLGDCICVHKRKERFSTQRKYKLQPRGDETFQVLERINDNAYKLDLSTTYGEEFDSMMNPFEEGGNDKNSTDKDKDNLHDFGGPMTRPKTKIMKQSLPDLSLGITKKFKAK
ncbi:hypothetical protein CR513_52841, partial [Mucuna pruriens]